MAVIQQVMGCLWLFCASAVAAIALFVVLLDIAMWIAAVGVIMAVCWGYGLVLL
jgi:hypothetical protein